MNMEYYSHVVKVINKKQIEKVNDIWSKKSNLNKVKESYINDFLKYTSFPMYLHLINNKKLPQYGSCFIEARESVEPIEEYCVDKHIYTFNEFMNKYGSVSKNVRQIQFESIEEPEFKIGDRVIRIRRDLKHYGEKATIKDIRKYPEIFIIEFDKKIGDENDDFKGKTKLGYGWSCSQNSIKKIKTISKHVKQIQFESFLNEEIKNKYIHTKTVVEINNEKELDIILNKLKGIMSFTKNSGRSEKDARDEVKKGIIYLSLYGQTIFKDLGETDYKNLNFIKNKRGYEGNDYKIITFKEFNNSLSTSKYVRQIQFEAVEPGQQIKDDIKKIKKRINVKIENEKESKEIQNFLFKNEIYWVDSQDTYFDILDIKKGYPVFFGITNGNFFFSESKKSISFNEFKGIYMGK